MWLLGVIPVLFFGGFVYQLVSEQDVLNMILQMMLVVMPALLFRFFWRERRRDEELLALLAAMPRDAELRVFEATVSFFVSVKVSTRHYIVGRDSMATPRLVCALTSLLLGWWSLPRGPLWTVQTLGQTLRGGRTVTVRELLPPEGPHSEVARVKPPW